MLTRLIVQCFFNLAFLWCIPRYISPALYTKMCKKIIFEIFLVHAYMFSSATYCYNLIFLW